MVEEYGVDPLVAGVVYVLTRSPAESHELKLIESNPGLADPIG